MLMQLPGIKPEWLAKELIKRLDDKLDITTAFQSMLPSIIAMNGMASRLAQGPQSAGRPDGLPGRRPGSRPGGGFERAARRSSRRAAPARPNRAPAAAEPDARASPYRRFGRPTPLRDVLFRGRHHRHGQTRPWRHRRKWQTRRLPTHSESVHEPPIIAGANEARPDHPRRNRLPVRG